MKRVLIAMLAIAGMLFATSCSEDESDDVTLTLSKNAIEFGQVAGEESVDVTTEAETWSAIGSAEWLDVKVNGAKLTVIAKANETVYDRTGKVLVVAGNANATIQVTQKGLKGLAEVTPMNILVPDKKGAAEVEVNANDAKWTAKSDADWLKVTAKPHKAEMLLTYEQNEVAEDRTAVVTVTVAGVETVVDVKQLGREVFVLPYGDLGKATVENIKNYENSLLHSLNEKNTTEMAMEFETRSKMYNKVTYKFVDETRANVKMVSVAIADFKTFKNEEYAEGFNEFLTQNGFDKSSAMSYVNKKNSVELTIKEDVFWGSVIGMHLEFKPVIEQPGDMPTFKEFPYGFTDWGAKKDGIDKYEADHNGTFNKGNSMIDDPESKKNDLLWYDVDKEGEGETSIRAYFVDHDDQPNPGLGETIQIMSKTTLAFYDAGDAPKMTREFKALCEKEGFKYVKFEKFHYFVNDAKKIGLAIRQVQFKGEKKPSLQINLFKMNKKESSFEQMLENENVLTL